MSKDIAVAAQGEAEVLVALCLACLHLLLVEVGKPLFDDGHIGQFFLLGSRSLQDGDLFLTILNHLQPLFKFSALFILSCLIENK